MQYLHGSFSVYVGGDGYGDTWERVFGNGKGKAGHGVSENGSEPSKEAKEDKPREKPEYQTPEGIICTCGKLLYDWSHWKTHCRYSEKQNRILCKECWLNELLGGRNV